MQVAGSNFFYRESRSVLSQVLAKIFRRHPPSTPNNGRYGKPKNLK